MKTVFPNTRKQKALIQSIYNIFNLLKKGKYPKSYKDRKWENK